MRDRRGRRTRVCRWAPPCPGILRGSSPVWRRQEQQVLLLCYLCPFPGPVWGRPRTRTRTASSHRFWRANGMHRVVSTVSRGSRGCSKRQQAGSAERNAPSWLGILTWFAIPFQGLAHFSVSETCVFIFVCTFNLGCSTTHCQILITLTQHGHHHHQHHHFPPISLCRLSCGFATSLIHLLFWCFLSRWLDLTAGTTDHLLSSIFGGAIINNSLGTRSFMQANRTKTLFQQNSRFSTL